MKKYLAILTLCLLTIANTPARAEITPHTPSSESEKRLDAILKRASKDENLFEFILKRPWYDPAKGSDYPKMFTGSLLKTWAETEAKTVQESCGGTYKKGEVCGMDYNPVTCSQDPPQTYLYYTDKSTGIVATYVRNSTKVIAHYKLQKEKGRWKLDGVDCGHGIQFHMHE